jgi:integrase/recombinase XerD
MTLLMNSEYYHFWKRHCNLSEKTIYDYQYVLRSFEAFLIQKGLSPNGKLNFDNFYFDNETGDYDPIDEIFIVKYINYLKLDNKASDHTLYNTITYLKNFFKFLKNSKQIGFNPMSYFTNPYYKRKITNRWISTANCNRLLSYCMKSDPFIKQDYVMILLLLTTGLRNTELRFLSLNQIDLENAVIYVDKGQKTSAQVVHMPEALVHALKLYIFHPKVQERIGTGNTLIFTNGDKPYTSSRLNLVLKRLAKSAGIKKNVSAHTFRYTTAKIMQDSGIDIISIQRQLRHVHVATTLRYLGISQNDKTIINDLSNLG